MSWRESPIMLCYNNAMFRSSVLGYLFVFITEKYKAQILCCPFPSKPPVSQYTRAKPSYHISRYIYITRKEGFSGCEICLDLNWNLREIHDKFLSAPNLHTPESRSQSSNITEEDQRSQVISRFSSASLESRVISPQGPHGHNLVSQNWPEISQPAQIRPATTNRSVSYLQCRTDVLSVPVSGASDKGKLESCGWLLL